MRTSHPLASGFCAAVCGIEHGAFLQHRAGGGEQPAAHAKYIGASLIRLPALRAALREKVRPM
jgi:hypothetical protein